MEKKSLLGLTYDELKKVVAENHMPPFAAKQLCEWLYKKKVNSIGEMTNLSLKNREMLAQRYEVGCYPPVEAVRSADGTVKYLYQTAGGPVEAVFIPEGERATLCVSSQVGCKMSCLFCMTGKQGFHGNLTAGEIVNQIQSLPERDRLTNVVFMGMGEPLDNADEVLKALEILTSAEGYAWSPTRITVSTIGVPGKLQRFLKESHCHLAVSLHNPFPEERAEIMPIERAFSIESVVEQLRKEDFAHQRRLSFEYIMFKGVNDSPRHASALLKLLKGLYCRINLIRFHPIPNVPLTGTPAEQMLEFRNRLTKGGSFTTIRASRGEDVLAACGMLSTAERLKQEKKN